MTHNDEKLERGHLGRRMLSRHALASGAILLACLPACRRNAPTVPTGDTPSQTAPAAERTEQEVWEAYYLQGGKIGYGHTSIRPVDRDGRALVETRTLNHLEVTRFGQHTEQDVKLQSLETSDGQLLEFETEVAFGPVPTIVSGRVEGDQMVITTNTQGRRATSRIPWQGEVRGFRGIEQSLAGDPLEPDERRTLRMLMPLVNQVADVELQAGQIEKTSVPGGEARLMPVDCLARLGDGQEIRSTAWVDEAGEVIKTKVAALEQESFRTTERLAKAAGPAGEGFDLGLDLIVPVEPPLERPHETHRVRYRVELADGDPARTFPTDSTQSVKPLGDHAAEVTVRSIRPGERPGPGEVFAPPDKDYTSANSILQSDDPRIVAMAREAQGAATDPAEVARALEKYVHREVSEKNFSHAFATAAEVAESRAGDCTEHAVLLAALARACDLPSRVAIGLVYVDRAGGFGYHMWTEVYLDGRWVPLDAILGQGGTSAAYLKLADSSLSGASPYSSFLAVANVLGRLKVSVLEQE